MISSNERTVLRELARRVAEVAALPIQAERRELWQRHNGLKPTRPLILVFPEGAWQELLPPRAFACESEAARQYELGLRTRLYGHEHFQDDMVVEKEWIVGKAIGNTGWGLEARHVPSSEARGSWRFDPVLREPADLRKLRFPEVIHDEAATNRAWQEAQELFGDILDVKLKGVAHVSYHLMNQYTGWRGLEEMMIDMYAEPQMLHEAMALLVAGHQRILRQYLDQNLLSLNNDSTYQSSGGLGYSDELPRAESDPARVSPADMWASAEAQELALVSPEQHAEFALQYERRLLEPFGLTGYGCCEDLSRKLDQVLAVPGIRRISIAPSADVDIAAAKLGSRGLFSWKPQPSHLVGEFNEELVRRYIRHTIEVALAHHCVLEMILKDTHTCEQHPDRFDRWTRIAREEVTRAGG